MERGRRVAHDDTEWRLVQDANYLIVPIRYRKGVAESNKPFSFEALIERDLGMLVHLT